MVNRLARETINDKSANLIAEALDQLDKKIADRVFVVELKIIASLKFCGIVNVQLLAFLNMPRLAFKRCRF